MPVLKERIEMSIKDYNFYLEQEVLSEFTAEILAEFSRYFMKNNISIDDIRNPVVILNNKLCELKATFYTDKVNSMEDLKRIENNFIFARSILKDIELKAA